MGEQNVYFRALPLCTFVCFRVLLCVFVSCCVFLGGSCQEHVYFRVCLCILCRLAHACKLLAHLSQLCFIKPGTCTFVYFRVLSAILPQFGALFVYFRVFSCIFHCAIRMRFTLLLCLPVGAAAWMTCGISPATACVNLCPGVLRPVAAQELGLSTPHMFQ